MQPTKESRDIFISHPENTEQNLCTLKEAYPGVEFTTLRPMVLESYNSKIIGNPHALPFSLQILPQAVELTATSASAWIKLLGSTIQSTLEGYDAPLRLHVFTIGKNSFPIVSKYCSLIEEGVTKLLLSLKKVVVSKSTLAPWRPNETIVQLLLLDNAQGLLSISPYKESGSALNLISRYAGGYLKIKDDRAPPSRAFKKLLEVELCLGREIAERESVVDLGAAPGGWSYIALKRGAKVTAVDRSALREDLMNNRNLTFIRGDGFKFMSKGAVDWVLCDVAAYPERSLEILQSWVVPKVCRFFAVTLKFKGSEDYAVVNQAEKLLSSHCRELFIKKLLSNKNEISVFGEVKTQSDHSH